VIEHDAARLSLVDLVVPGLADPTRTVALRGHVAACEACQEELADLEHLHRALRTAGAAPRPPERLRRRVLAQARPEVPPDVRPWRIASVVLAALCVVFALLFAIALIAA
jgi:anti-sigma factor RsiW